MLEGEKLVWVVALAALVAGLLVSLAVGRARTFERGERDFQLVINVLGLGLLVMVLVAVAFVAGYAGIEDRHTYVLVCISVIGFGAVLYTDTAGARKAKPKASGAAPPPEPTIDLARFEHSFAAPGNEHSPEVLAAAARAEATFAGSAAAEAPSPERSRASAPPRR